jgi:hypothetical protein
MREIKKAMFYRYALDYEIFLNVVLNYVKCRGEALERKNSTGDWKEKRLFLIFPMIYF